MTDSITSVAKRASTAIEKGEIDQAALGRLQQRLAQEMFPTDSMGVALSKFFSSPAGAEMLNAGLRKNREDMQKSIALSATVPLSKAWGNEASMQRPYMSPEVEQSDESLHTTGHSPGKPDQSEPWDSKTFDKAVEMLMAHKNIPKDQAITEIYRAEKRSRGMNW